MPQKVRHSFAIISFGTSFFTHLTRLENGDTPHNMVGGLERTVDHFEWKFWSKKVDYCIFYWCNPIVQVHRRKETKSCGYENHKWKIAHVERLVKRKTDDLFLKANTTWENEICEKLSQDLLYLGEIVFANLVSSWNHSPNECQLPGQIFLPSNHFPCNLMCHFSITDKKNDPFYCFPLPRSPYYLSTLIWKIVRTKELKLCHKKCMMMVQFTWTLIRFANQLSPESKDP